MIILDPHQVEGVDFILEHEKAALFMEVGTGKTYTSLELYKIVQPKRCLIITTPRLVNEGQWQEEIVEYLGYYPDNIDLISHRKISVRYDEYIKKYYDMIIFDECHKIKAKYKASGGTKISRLMFKLSRRATYVVSMTGTPLAKDYIDVFNIYRNSDIDIWKGCTEKDFIKEYYLYEERDFHGAGFKTIMPLGLRRNKKDELKRMIDSKSFVVETKKVVVGLGDRFFKKVMVDGINTEKIYKDAVLGIIDIDGFQQTYTKLERDNIKRQASNGFIYRTLDEFGTKEVLEFSTKKVDKFRKIVPILNRKHGKLIVVYFFKRDLENIQNTLKALKLTYTKHKKEFIETSDVMLLHYSASEGLNLQKNCNATIFYSYDSGFLNFEQLCGRTHRRGQTKDCYYYVLISKGTINEEQWVNIKARKSKDRFIKERN